MRYRFGLKQLIYVILGVGATALIGNVDFGPTVNSCRVIQPELILSSFLAFISGPAIGSLIGILGYILGRLLVGQQIMWGIAFANMIVGLGIGMYAGSYEAYKGEFRGVRILIFNTIQTIACSFAFLLVYTLFAILLYRIPVTTALQTGIGLFLVNIVIIGITVSPLGLIYNAYMRVQVKKKELLKETQKEKQGVK